MKIFRKMEDSYIWLEKPGISRRSNSTLERMCHPPNITSEMEISAALSFFLSFFASRLVVVVVVVVDLYQWTCCVESKQESGQACTGAGWGGGVWRLKHWVKYIYCFLISCFVYTTRNQQAKPYMVPPPFWSQAHEHLTQHKPLLHMFHNQWIFSCTFQLCLGKIHVICLRRKSCFVKERVYK